MKCFYCGSKLKKENKYFLNTKEIEYLECKDIKTGKVILSGNVEYFFNHLNQLF